MGRRPWESGGRARRSGRRPYRQVHGGVDAEGRLLGGEGLPGPGDEVGVAGAGLGPADELRQLLAAQRRVVGLAQRQEVGGQVARHHLPRVHEDVGGEQPERVDAWKRAHHLHARVVWILVPIRGYFRNCDPVIAPARM